MSTSTVLNLCGCCEGVQPLTPASIVNSPGLTALSYRVGTYSDFRESMIASLPQFPALSRLLTRSDDDLSIALMDAWAMIADVLSFYQERIANEGFLNTATERLSVLELARAISYELNPGLAASTYLAFTLENTQGAVSQSTIPIGTKVQSLPIQGQIPPQPPQIFETIDQIVAFPALSALTPNQVLPQFGENSDFSKLSSLTFSGIKTGLNVGDSLLITETDSEKERPMAVAVVTGVTVNSSVQQTSVKISQVTTKTGFSGENFLVLEETESQASSSTPTSISQIDAQYLRQLMKEKMTLSGLTALLINNNWELDDFVNVVNSLTPELQRTGRVKVYSFGAKAGVFGNNAQPYDTLPVSYTGHGEQGSSSSNGPAHPPYPNPWEHAAIDTDSQGKPRSETSVLVALDSKYPTTVADTWVILRSPDAIAVYPLSAVSEGSIADYMMAAKVTLLTLDVRGDETKLPHSSSFNVRNTTIFLESELLDLVFAADTNPISGEMVTLDDVVLEGLLVGQQIVVTGMPVSYQSTGQNGPSTEITVSEIATIADIVPLSASPIGTPVTKIQLQDPLANSYVRSTVVINANVATATHGETKNEVLGGGNPSQAYLDFTLRQANNAQPLTYIPSSTGQGATSTLNVSVNGVPWNEVDSLYGVEPQDQTFIARIEDTMQVDVIFGAARPSAGSQNITATYRVGTGTPGMVKAGQLSQLVTRVLGVKGVTNPMDATGAQDPEQIDSARENAPLGVLTLDRIVSLDDFSNFALTFPGIGKAIAFYQLDNLGRKVVSLVVASATGSQVLNNSLLYTSLVAAIHENADPNIPFNVISYAPVSFEINGWIIVSSEANAEEVQQAVVQALENEFSFSSMQFGQSVIASTIVATMQQVSGVVAAGLNSLYLSGFTPSSSPPQVLPAESTEILVLDAGGLQISPNGPPNEANPS
jgi:hypothetical protein